MPSRWFVKRVWRPLLRRAAVRYRKPHLVRHTVLSLLLQRGAPLPYVTEIAGHSSPAFTARVYSHALPQANRGVMAGLYTPATARNRGATEPEPARVLTAGMAN